MDETHLSMFHSVSNSARGRRLRNSISSRYAFNSFFFFYDCTIFTLQDFYIESVTAHRIKRNYHSCFHNSWPNSKSKLKLKHLWEMVAGEKHIINTSLRTGIFPTAFKQARVTPLLKKPTLNTSLLENYRLVSLLPFVAKTLERVVFNQLSLFLSQYNKLDAKQSGFRSGHSTETALLSVTEALRIAKADSKSSVLILLDLSAAFDTVNHQILLSTLSTLGITGIPLRWFESYLTGRSFRVAWGGEVSKAHQLVTGVPQGSVLGPLLFSTYTTSLGPIIQAHGFSYHCYADDTQLYLSFQPDDPTVAAWISGCLADISAWMKEHHLQLNLAKTELLVFPATPTLQHDFSIQLGTSIITPSTSVRNLGVIFDDQLTFKEHIAKTAQSCRFALHNIRKIRPFLTEHAAQLLVQALVVSRLDYCNALLARDATIPFFQIRSDPEKFWVSADSDPILAQGFFFFFLSM